MILKEKNCRLRKVFGLSLALLLTYAAQTKAQAQGSPVPGQPGAPVAGGSGAYGVFQGQPVSGLQSSGYGQSAQMDGNPGSASGGMVTSAPVPGAGHVAGAPAARSGGAGQKYRDLPLTPEAAKLKVDELRAQLVNSRPQDVAESIQELCEWLADAADAHYRMYLSFAKSEGTKPQANSEKALNQRFGQLKREAQMLKADLLVKQLRAPEALAPLVEIVVADPRSTTGQEAYKRLVELGFSQAIPQATAAAVEVSPPAAAGAGPAKAAMREIKVQASSQPLKPLH